MTEHNIRVTAHWGGLDTAAEIYVIGPYPTAADRDHAMSLDGICDLDGMADLEETTVPVASAHASCTPAEAAAAATWEDLCDAFENSQGARP